MNNHAYHKTLIIIISAFFLIPDSAQACTSFTVQGKKKMYGMNFDYPNVELRFVITHTNNRKIFQAQFIENNGASAICGMNDGGVFSSIQMLYPQVTTWPARKPNEITLFDAYFSVLSSFDTLQQAYQIIDSAGIKVIHIPQSSLHNFFADKYGNACVLEVGAEKNLLTKVANNFMVMTNFPINQFVGTPLGNINGVGADRYKTAFQYIQTHQADFDLDHGIAALQGTVQSTGEFPTQCSLVFDPELNEVYIIVRRDFTKIWKVSLANETIETYRGFSQAKKIALPTGGVLASELQKLTSVPKGKSVVPKQTQLNQNYPNPFNPATEISFQVARRSEIVVNVYDLLGKEVAHLVNEVKEPGTYRTQWNAEDVPGGIYFCSMKAGSLTDVKKLILVK
jgi:hypothetical protein